MGVNSTLEIIGNVDIEFAVFAFDNVDVPGHKMKDSFLGTFIVVFINKNYSSSAF
jgi:hypothetical protein